MSLERKEWLGERGIEVPLDGTPYAAGLRVGRKTAGGTIPAYGLVTYSGSAYVAAGANAENVVGSSLDRVARTSGQKLQIVRGGAKIEAAAAILDGALLKAYPDGRMGPALTAALLSTQINPTDTTFVGAAFTNQPAGDDIEVVSSSSADTTQTVTIVGYLTSTLVIETKTLTGGTQVVFDNDGSHYTGVIAVLLDEACAGTVTVREASGNATICTLAPGAIISGIVAAISGEQNGYCNTVQIAASGASTAYVALLAMNVNGDRVVLFGQLNGTTKVSLSSAYSLVDGSADSSSGAADVYQVIAAMVGTLAADRTLEIYTKATADAESRICGRAQQNISEDATGNVIIW